VRTGADISRTEDAGDEATSADGAPHSLAEAARIKENYLALLRRLEFEEKSKQVVATEDVGAIVSAEYAIVRNRLSGIPTDAAQRLANLCSAEEVEAFLSAEICTALHELALA
jgi:phage terminase Nu1 subunit (DNA packaging protein)